MAVLNAYGHRILLSHEPIDLSLYGYAFTVNVHGHLHDGQHRLEEYPFLSDRNILYSCEKYHYQVMPLKSLLGV